MRQITKRAQEIYQETTTDCRIHIKNWGYNPETDGGFNSVTTEEPINTRLINDLKEIHKSKINLNEMNLRYKIIDQETYLTRINILIMVEKTIGNTERHLKEFNESLKS